MPTHPDVEQVRFPGGGQPPSILDCAESLSNLKQFSPHEKIPELSGPVGNHRGAAMIKSSSFPIGDFARGQRHDDAVLTLHPTGQATR